MKGTFHPRWVFHLLGWLLLGLAYALMLGNPDDYQTGIGWGILLVAGQAILVYSNSRWLMPSFFFKRQYVLYGLLAAGLLTGVIYSAQEISKAANLSPRSRYEKRKSDNQSKAAQVEKTVETVSPQSEEERKRRKRIRDYYRFWKWIGRAFPYLIALAFSAVYEVTKVAEQREKQAVSLQKEKLETELKFLKSQTNPHFLFNALNNIYALSVMGSAQTPENLLKLSDMLRYMLYEADAPTVALAKELEYLRNYIDLQQLKDSEGLNIRTEWSIEDPSLPIAPLILIPFVENAFKHSRIENLEKGWIRIRLTGTDRQLECQVENSRFSDRQKTETASGIGLQNVIRRLDLLYPGKHKLTIREEKDRFFVLLKLELV